MGAPEAIKRPPELFTNAVDEVRGARVRSELVVESMPPPRRIAPFAYAMSGDVVVRDEELATGRFILLFDPRGEDTWGGQFRCVTYARADVETEMAADPMLPDVGWSWLTESLEVHDAQFVEASGSVTVVRSEAYGHMADDGSSAQMEIRASWTPQSDKAEHVRAWSDLLCQIAGLPLIATDVIMLPNRRGQR